MKALLSFIAAAILVFGLFMSPAKAIVLFDDVRADHPFAFEIAYLHEEGIINGYRDGTFRPDDPVTRAHAVAMIGRALNLDDTPRAPGFRDVSKNHLFSGYIASAVEEEIVFGFANNYFLPERSVTRAQTVVMLDRALPFPEAEDNGFRDMRANHFAFDAVSRLTDYGVVRGYPDNTFRPDAPVTRAQLSAFLARAIEPSLILEKKNLLSTANEILADLKAKEFDDVAAHVSNADGLLFCPYSGGCLDDGGVTFTKAQLPDFMSNLKTYLWGHEDGSGFEIRLTPAQYYGEYLLDAAYTAKDRYDRREHHTFINEGYPEATVVEYYYPGTAANSFMDWQSLSMVFGKNSNGDWVLVALINDRWTI